jgi:hypothetical protein
MSLSTAMRAQRDVPVGQSDVSLPPDARASVELVVAVTQHHRRAVNRSRRPLFASADLGYRGRFADGDSAARWPLLAVPAAVLTLGRAPLSMSCAGLLANEQSAGGMIVAAQRPDHGVTWDGAISSTG